MPYVIGISLLSYLLKSLQSESDKHDLISGVYSELEHVELDHMANGFSIDRTERGPKNDSTMTHS